MRSFWRCSLLLCLLVSTVIGAGQPPSTSEVLAQMPACAQICVLNAVTNSTCLPTNQTCVCTNNELQQAARDCVRRSCSAKQSLLTMNITQSTCGAPVRDIRRNYIILNIIFGVVIVISVFQRIVTKLYWKLGIENDDWCILLTTIFLTIPSTVINDRALVANGMGLDIWTLPYDMITRFSTWFHIMAVLYFTQVSLIKLTLLFFYLRVFSVSRTRYIIIATMVFNCTYGVIYALVTIFQCLPVGYLSVRWMGEHEGKCININAVTWSNAAISIAVDLWILLIPLLHLKSLQLDWKKKVGAGLMFITGTAFTVISIIRLHTLINFDYIDNPTYAYIEISKWSTAEVSVGAICVCMPSYRLLFLRLFRSGTSDRHQYAPDNDSSTAHSYLRATATDGQTFDTLRIGSANGVRYDSKNIEYRRKYGIEFNDLCDDVTEDETTLVYMTEINTKCTGLTGPQII